MKRYIGVDLDALKRHKHRFRLCMVAIGLPSHRSSKKVAETITLDGLSTFPANYVLYKSREKRRTTRQNG
jgi:hypothetical protein